MPAFTYYDDIGRIHLVGITRIPHEREEGWAWVEGYSDATKEYVVDGQIVPRPVANLVADKTSIKADGVDTLRVGVLPAPAFVRLSGPAFDNWEEADSHVELTVDHPGSYRLEITAWPYQTVEIRFDAT